MQEVRKGRRERRDAGGEKGKVVADPGDVRRTGAPHLNSFGGMTYILM